MTLVSRKTRLGCGIGLETWT